MNTIVGDHVVKKQFRVVPPPERKYAFEYNEDDILPEGVPTLERQNAFEHRKDSFTRVGDHVVKKQFRVVPPPERQNAFEHRKDSFPDMKMNDHDSIHYKNAKKYGFVREYLPIVFNHNEIKSIKLLKKEVGQLIAQEAINVGQINNKENKTLTKKAKKSRFNVGQRNVENIIKWLNSKPTSLFDYVDESVDFKFSLGKRREMKTIIVEVDDEENINEILYFLEKDYGTMGHQETNNTQFVNMENFVLELFPCFEEGVEGKPSFTATKDVMSTYYDRLIDFNTESERLLKIRDRWFGPNYFHEESLPLVWVGSELLPPLGRYTDLPRPLFNWNYRNMI